MMSSHLHFLIPCPIKPISVLSRIQIKNFKTPMEQIILSAHHLSHYMSPEIWGKGLKNRGSTKGLIKGREVKEGRWIMKGCISHGKV